MSGFGLRRCMNRPGASRDSVPSRRNESWQDAAGQTREPRGRILAPARNSVDELGPAEEVGGGQGHAHAGSMGR